MDAEEVTHDTILKYLNLDYELEEHQQKSWLVKTCVRASIDLLRRHKSEKIFLEEYKEFENENELEAKGEMMWGELKVGKKDLVKRIKNALALLPDRYRAVLSMILFEGFDYEEVASVLGVKEATVRSQYMRGKIKLAELVK